MPSYLSLIRSFFQKFAQIGKGSFLPLVLQHMEKLFQKRSGPGMDGDVILCILVVFQRGRAGIGFALIHLTCSYPVADHLGHIPQRHLIAHQALLLMVGNVNPILIMMLIPALMVEPGPGIPHGLTLSRIGTAVSLIIPDPGPELFRAVLGKIMGKPLPVKANLEAMLPDQVSVPCNGRKMVPYITDFYA